uniref:Putative ovule protein n=1 Tax=Solanum chacoense TaxID=4108 RepID=A0A0V0GX66_SOLCH
MDKTIKPFWYIEQETLVSILQVIKELDEDLKRKIVSIIALRNKKEEERHELRYNSYSFHYEINMMDISDYYFSE